MLINFSKDNEPGNMLFKRMSIPCGHEFQCSNWVRPNDNYEIGRIWWWDIKCFSWVASWWDSLESNWIAMHHDPNISTAMCWIGWPTSYSGTRYTSVFNSSSRTSIKRRAFYMRACKFRPIVRCRVPIGRWAEPNSKSTHFFTNSRIWWTNVRNFIKMHYVTSA